MIELVYETHSTTRDNEQVVAPFEWQPGWKDALDERAATIL